MFKNDLARAIAFTEGLTRYDGRLCSRCDTTERYVSSGGCIRCSLARAQQRAASTPRYQPRADSARGEARAANAKTFTGHPCITCGATERYTSSGACTHCAKTAQVSPSRTHQSRRDLALAIPHRPDDLTCECCGRPSATLVVDHDHELEELGFPPSETFRGWICIACNAGLGRLGDNVAGVRRALDYLTKKRGPPHEV